MSNKQEKEARRLAAMHAQPPAKLQNILGLDAKRFHPMADQVLLDVQLEEQRGSIIVPVAAQQRELGGLPLGRVLAVGDGVTRVKVGDLVLADPREAKKIDVLLWLTPDTKLLARVDPPSVLAAQ
jgi:co-chaperonin GroES (HSP10)